LIRRALKRHRPEESDSDSDSDSDGGIDVTSEQPHKKAKRTESDAHREVRQGGEALRTSIHAYQKAHRDFVFNAVKYARSHKSGTGRGDVELRPWGSLTEVLFGKHMHQASKYASSAVKCADIIDAILGDDKKLDEYVAASPDLREALVLVAGKKLAGGTRRHSTEREDSGEGPCQVQ
jgi:hypothetical protein